MLIREVLTTPVTVTRLAERDRLLEPPNVSLAPESNLILGNRPAGRTGHEHRHGTDQGPARYSMGRLVYRPTYERDLRAGSTP
jgi:hypothetical protein